MMAAAARRRAALLLLLLPAALTTITMTVRPGEAECCYEYAHPGAELSFEVFTQAGHHLADQKAEVRIAVAQYAFSADDTTEREAESAIDNAETEFFPAGEADVYRFTPVSEKTYALCLYNNVTTGATLFMTSPAPKGYGELKRGVGKQHTPLRHQDSGL